ncbi:hypothetical protein EZV62_003549 [Acer yangbiense]|uniref:Uncharacterized protein n=1 Tax=Acer yangbiense TaxID=1000413 RepID=A0A5C7II08_9ROSI|nr:hypothetical protein EZV62_003549 [Acer yangbiense]
MQLHLVSMYLSVGKVAADGSFADSSRWLQAISVLTEVIMLNPCLPDTYHTLGLVYDTIGNAEKAAGFYELAAEINPRDSTMWKQLRAYFVNINKAKRCLKKAVRADPSDITLRFHLASLYVQLGDYQRAAELQLCPENVKALKTGTILEDYLKSHPSEANSGIIDLLASVLMETNAYDKALQHIKHSHLVYYSGEELPLNLKIRAGICHIHLKNMEKSEILLTVIQRESVSAHAKFIIEVADIFKNFGYVNLF